VNSHVASICSIKELSL